VLEYLAGFSIVACVPGLILWACLSDTGFPIDVLGFRQRRRPPQRLSPQVSLFARRDHHTRLNSPSTSPSGFPGSGSSFPQPKQVYLPSGPVQSRELSRQPKASSLPALAEDDNQGLCICRELLVPEGKECCLLIPRVITKDAHPPGRVSIVSMDGATVFSVILGSSWHGNSALHSKRLLTLKSAVADGVVFASCDAVFSDQGEPERLAINDSDGEHFADVQSCARDRSAVLAARSGPLATIRYEDQEAGRILIADSNGWLLAVAEVIDDFVHAVRIGAKVDAGLITITMLSFSLLEPEHKVDGCGVTCAIP